MKEYLAVTFRDPVAESHAAEDSVVANALKKTSISDILADPLMPLLDAQAEIVRGTIVKKAVILTDADEVKRCLQSVFIRVYELAATGTPVEQNIAENPKLKALFDEFRRCEGMIVQEETGPAYSIKMRETGEEVLKLRYEETKARSTPGAIKFEIIKALGRKYGLAEHELSEGIERNKEPDKIVAAWATDYSRAMQKRIVDESARQVAEANPANKFSWKPQDAKSVLSAVRETVKSGLGAAYIPKPSEDNGANKKQP